MPETKERKFTEKIDRNGKKIFDGDRIRGMSIEGEILDYRVKWSDYRGCWIGDNSGEMYDVGEKRFHEFEVIESGESQ